MTRLDAVVVGGGLAGSTIARSLAIAGASVVIVERERRFRDRVRGEGMFPWGAAEARALGTYSLLAEHCGSVFTRFAAYVGGRLETDFDLPTTAPYYLPGITFLHQRMQEAMLAAAANAGARVVRGAVVTDVAPGDRPTVSFTASASTEHLAARLVIVADGRESRVARVAGFTESRDPPHLFTGGMLVTSAACPDRSLEVYSAPHGGHAVIAISPAPGYLRLYLISHRDVAARRLSGKRDLTEALEQMREIGVPGGYLRDVQLEGPFATFDGAHRWVEQPYRDGVVLLGDAAAASDPAWGQGLARTLRDARLLRDALLEQDDWLAGADQFAARHDEFTSKLREVERLQATLFFDIGAEADARRERAGEYLADPSFEVGLFGPDTRNDPEMRARLLGG